MPENAERSPRVFSRVASLAPTWLASTAPASQACHGSSPRIASGIVSLRFWTAAQLPTVTGDSARGLAAACGVAGAMDARGAGSTVGSFEPSGRCPAAVVDSGWRDDQGFAVTGRQ